MKEEVITPSPSLRIRPTRWEASTAEDGLFLLQIDEDEDGEFLLLSKPSDLGNDGDTLRIDLEEWETLKSAVDYAFSVMRENKER